MPLNSTSLLAAAQSTAADTAKAIVDTAKTAVDSAKVVADSAKADTNFLKLLDDYSGGILVLFLSLATIVLLIQWVAWIFLMGRFKPKPPESGTGPGDRFRQSSLRFVFADLLVKIINDFRHLLALLMVTIFALALMYALYSTGASADANKMPNIKDALQAVVATLGGLVGSILGYYFGEAAARKSFEELERPKVDVGDNPMRPALAAVPVTTTTTTAPEPNQSAN